MNRSEAMKALVKAGRSAEVVKVIERAAEAADRSYSEVRSDRSRTPEWTRWALAVASKQQRKSMDAELIRMAGSVVSTDRSDAEKVFGVAGLAGDAASLVISRRDAADRVERVEDRDELREMLTRATRSGDEVLARAIAERAVRMEDGKTMEQFLQDRPALQEAGERLWAAEHNKAHGFGVTMQLMALKPAELDGMSFDSIDGVADAGEPGSAAASGW